MAHVELKGLHKAFGGFQAISDVSLQVEKGEFCALLGMSIAYRDGMSFDAPRIGK